MSREVTRTHLGAVRALDTAHFGPLQRNGYGNIMLFHQGRIVSDNDVAGSGFCDGQSRGFLLSVAFTHHGAACDYVKGGKMLPPASRRHSAKEVPRGARTMQGEFTAPVTVRYFSVKGCPWDAL